MNMPTIPLIDVREGGAVRHAVEGAARARALRDDCLSFLPAPLRAMVPLFDGIARRWLTQARAPYAGEIAAIAKALGFPGVWLLNGSYQWGCTSIARNHGGMPWLARTLDWPFPGLGRHVEVAHQKGPAGDFYNVTWPGYVGVLTAMAPRRFAASMNQAPMRRRTRHPYLRPYDIAANAINTWRLRHIPPDQLLRRAMSECGDFAQARRVLEETPVARPVLYALAGCRAGEHCIIERTEESFRTHIDGTAVANDWIAREAGWEARIAGNLLFSCSHDEAANRSHRRRTTLVNFGGEFGRDAFPWVVEPVLNSFTRYAVEMCPAAGILRLRGYDALPGQMLPQPRTEMLEIAAEKVAA